MYDFMLVPGMCFWGINHYSSFRAEANNFPVRTLLGPEFIIVFILFYTGLRNSHHASKMDCTVFLQFPNLKCWCVFFTILNAIWASHLSQENSHFYNIWHRRRKNREREGNDLGATFSPPPVEKRKGENPQSQLKHSQLSLALIRIRVN